MGLDLRRSLVDHVYHCLLECVRARTRARPVQQQQQQQ